VSTNAFKKIIIDPVTRVEGHARVTILLDEANQVKQARLHIVEFRGFERFIQGRLFWEVPVLVQRLCGICPVSHHLAAAKAMDRIVGAEKLTPTAEKMRRLMHYGQVFQSHALHFFHLVSPDLLFGFDAEPAIRNFIGVAARHPDLAMQGVMMRKYGQEIIRATAGKKIHGTGAIPGGINKNLSIEERDFFLKDVDQMTKWAEGALKIAKDYTMEHLAELKPFGSFESNHVSLVRQDGAMDLYHGNLRAIDANGNKIFDQVDYQKYVDYIAEEVHSWSYMKSPFIKSLGSKNGWYRVGPLARVNACDFIDTPGAEAARKEFMAVTNGKPNNITMAYHWSRMVESVHVIEKIKALLHDPDLQGTDLVVKGARRGEGIAVVEAPRGILFHHYRVNENDQVVMANLIVATTHNNEAMNRAVEQAAREYLSGVTITEGLLNRVEVAIRASDPCLSCARHALSTMPLMVDLFDYEGNLLDRKTSAGEAHEFGA
jgi:NAD-reducing hydrogenase large subunit